MDTRNEELSLLTPYFFPICRADTLWKMEDYYSGVSD